LPPAHAPFWQVSVRVQALPSTRAVPSALFVQAVVLAPGWQDWHWLAGLVALGA
jgi:hypothetical protein